MYIFYWSKVLAEGATKDYDAFQADRKRIIINARNRAKSAYQAHVNHQKEERQRNFEDDVFFISYLGLLA